MAGRKITGTVIPFKPYKQPLDTAIGGTAKRFLETGFKVDIVKDKLIVEKEGKKTVFDIGAVISDNKFRIKEKIIAEVPSSATIDISEFSNIQKGIFSEPFKRYLARDKRINLFTTLEKPVGEFLETSGIQEKLIGKSGTGKIIITRAEKGIEKIKEAKEKSFEIASKEFGKLKESKAYQTVREFYPRKYETEVVGGTLVLKQKPETPVTFGEVLDIGYARGIDVYKTWIPKDSKVLKGGLEIAERIKPTSAIKETALLYATGYGAKQILLRGHKIIKTGFKLVGGILTTAYVGAVGLEVALAEPEERIPIIGQRAIEFGVGVAAFKIGFKAKPQFKFKGMYQSEKFQLDLSKRMGKPFPEKQLTKFVPLKVAEVGLSKRGAKITIETLEFKQKRPGYDVQRFLFEPAKQRQLKLAEGGKNPFSDKTYYSKEQLKSFGNRQLNKKLTDFKFKKPLTGPQAYLVSEQRFEPVKLKESSISNKLLTFKTETGKILQKYKPEPLPEVAFRVPRTRRRTLKYTLGRMFASKKGSLIQEFQPEAKIYERSKLNIEPKLELEPKLEVGTEIGLEGLGVQESLLLGSLSIPKTEEAEKERARIITTPKFKFKSVPDDITKVFIKSTPRIKEAEKIKEDVIEKQDSDVISIPKITTITILQMPKTDIIKVGIPEPEKPKTPTPKIPKLELNLEFKPQKGKPKQAYNSYAKQKGKFIRLNKQPLPINKAFNLMQEVVDNTPSATGKLKKTNKKTRLKDDLFRKGEYKFYKKGETYIEKNTHRIDSYGEKMGITIKGHLARIRKRMFF